MIEVVVYDTYAILVCRDWANPANIDRRLCRDGEVDDASAGPIDDRVDARRAEAPPARRARPHGRPPAHRPPMVEAAAATCSTLAGAFVEVIQ